MEAVGYRDTFNLETICNMNTRARRKRYMYIDIDERPKYTGETLPIFSKASILLGD